MHKNFPIPGDILLSIIPRLDERKTQGKHENSIIFTSQRCYISDGECLITIQSVFNTLYISKYKINRFFKKQFVFSAKAAESVAFEKGSHCRGSTIGFSDPAIPPFFPFNRAIPPFFTSKSRSRLNF